MSDLLNMSGTGVAQSVQRLSNGLGGLNSPMQH
jgi:hypothetical protein